MAEVVAAVGLTAAIVQFVAFSGKIIKRLDEFASATDNIPATFWDIKVQLPLLIDTLQRNQRQAEEGPIGETAAIALKAVIERGLEEAQTLMKILDRALPKDASSSFEI
jgi:N-terminal domain on NACHT_NTPase and P-loop NTPases